MGGRDGPAVPSLALGKRASMLGQEAQGRPVSTDRSVGHVPISTWGSTLAGVSADVAREFQVSLAQAHPLENRWLTLDLQHDHTALCDCYSLLEANLLRPA